MLFRSSNPDFQAMGLKTQEMVGMEEEMRMEIQEAFHKFLSQFSGLESITFTQHDIINSKIVALACFCAHARCPVDRDYRTRNVQYIPEPEGPGRLVKQFTQIGKGLSLVHGKTTIEADEYEILQKIGRDLVSPQRLKIIKYLWGKKICENK